MATSCRPQNGLVDLNNTTAIGSGVVITASNSVRIGNIAVTSIGGQVGWSTLSDVRFKTRIQPQNHGLDFILQLQPITYYMDVKKLNQFLYGSKADSLKGDALWKEDIRKKENTLYSGFSAQAVEAAARRVGYDFSGVHAPENDHDHYSLNYADFVVPLVKCIQEQHLLIEQLQKENEVKKQALEALQQKQNDMISRLQKLENALLK